MNQVRSILEDTYQLAASTDTTEPQQNQMLKI